MQVSWSQAHSIWEKRLCSCMSRRGTHVKQELRQGKQGRGRVQELWPGSRTIPKKVNRLCLGLQTQNFRSERNSS